MIQQMEEWIRIGQFVKVERALNEMNFKSVLRSDRVKYANIARRISRYHLSLRILNPIIRSETHLQDPPSHIEKIEYAESLRKLGALSEAVKILETVDLAQHPQAHLHLAFCCFSQWKSALAIPHLKAYLAATRDSSYGVYVARTNLASALISEGLILEAQPILEVLLDDCSRLGYSLLKANALELSAQIQILYKFDFVKANGLLDEAEKLLSDSTGSSDQLFIKKWRAINLSLSRKSVAGELQDVRRAAISLAHWETVRDCDFHIALLSKNQELMKHLYFGTPYEAFRTRLSKNAGLAMNWPECFLWKGQQSPSPVDILDLLAGATTNSRAGLKAGQAVHRLLLALCQDFYKPQPQMSLFAQIFPNEYYNVTTSANRVQQLIRRLRLWFKKSQIPLTIREQSGGYALQFNGPIAIQVPIGPLPFHQQEIEFLRIQRDLIAPFTNRDVCRLTRESTATAQRLINWGIQNQKLVCVGNGPNKTYTYSNPKESLKAA